MQLRKIIEKRADALSHNSSGSIQHLVTPWTGEVTRMGRMTTLPAAHHIPLRAVLFDRDDTIAYTDREVYAEAARWAAQTYGLDAQAVGTAMLE